MEKPNRSSSKDYSLKILQIKLGFKEENDENSLWYAAAITYFFGVLYAYLIEAIERTLGLVLILLAVFFIWAVRDIRKEIRRKYECEIEKLRKRET